MTCFGWLARHYLVEPIPLYNAYFDFEKVAQVGRGEDVGLGAVGQDAALFEEDDAFHLGRDLLDAVGDQDEGLALGNQAAHQPDVLEAGLQVEAVGGLVQDEDVGVVDERARQQKPPLLPRGHLPEGGIRQAANAEHLHERVRARHLLGRVHLVGPDADAGVEARENDVPSAHVVGIGVVEFVGDEAQPRAQVPHVPALQAEEAHVRAVLLHGVDLAREEFEEGRLARAVGAEDGRVLPLGNGQGQVVEHARAPPIDGRVADVDDGREPKLLVLVVLVMVGHRTSSNGVGHHDHHGDF